MPAADKAFERLTQRLIDAADADQIDMLLDHWFDIRNRATEWDAMQWGFNPDRWMSKSRERMEERIMADARQEVADLQAARRAAAAQAARAKRKKTP